MSFRQLHIVVVGYRQTASQAVGLPVGLYHSTELAFDACANGALAMAPPVWRRNFGAARFRPDEFQFARLCAPREFDTASVARKRSILCCVGSEFVQCECDCLSSCRRE